MHSLIRSIYDLSPVSVQNAMISFYGLNLYRKRYGGIHAKALEFLRETERQSRDHLDSLAAERLISILKHAAEHVPFYRKRFVEAGIRPAQIRSKNDLSGFPIVTKDDIRQNPDDFLSAGFRKKNLVAIHTSGTTGTPLDFFFEKSAIQCNYAFFARFLGWAGVRPTDRSATFAGRIFIPRRQARPPFWRTNRVMNNTLFSSYHLSESNIPLYIEQLERVSPDFIDSYPSAVYVVARHILEHGIRHAIRPRAVITSSETLLEHQRNVIEEAFGCKVYDQYGSAEMAVFIGQCEHGAYHINPEYGMVEFLDDHGNPVGAGQPGELVCTGFLNFAMPLIRYSIGDTAVLSAVPCPCGRNFPVVSSLLGRTDDLIVTKNGSFVGRLDPVFKGLSSIKEAQIQQESRDLIVVKLVRDAGYATAHEQTLVHALQERLGRDMAIRIDYVDAIPRTASGKFRSVVSNMPETEKAWANEAQAFVSRK